MNKMKKKLKFGKRVNVYLSYDAINKLSKLTKLTKNKSAFIEALIHKSFINKFKKCQEKNH